MPTVGYIGRGTPELFADRLDRLAPGARRCVAPVCCVALLMAMPTGGGGPLIGFRRTHRYWEQSLLSGI